MKSIFLLLPLFILGCSTNVSKIEYPEIPDPISKPIPELYNFKVFEIDNIIYYTFDEENAKILLRNWIQYKNWAESNFKLLQMINKSKDLKQGTK